MALLFTPGPPNTVRVTCSCGLVDCLVHDVELGVFADALDRTDLVHSC